MDEIACNPEDAVRIALDGVSKRFPNGTTAVENVSLTVRTGDFVALLGPSGCGKSTLLRLAAGLEQPTSGTVSTGPASVGYIFQEPNLLPWRTVAANVELSAELAKVPAPLRRERSRAAIEAVGLDGFEKALPHTLSGGMRMRASLARALTLEPDLLLLDEPFGALDEITRLEMQVELQRLHLERRFTAVFVTHSAAEAVFLADRVVVLAPRPGRIEGVVDVDLPYPRTPDLRFEPKFTELAREVSALIRSTR